MPRAPAALAGRGGRVAVGKFLLSVHVVAAIIFIGPVTVAVSLFPRYARAALAGDGNAVATLLHRISRVYAVLGLSVPVFGFAVALKLGVLTDAWLLTSIALTAAAGALLAFVVLPGQQRVMAALAPGGPDAAPRVGTPARLAMPSGVFAVLWVVVVVLMIVRPGSTTGV